MFHIWSNFLQEHTEIILLGLDFEIAITEYDIVTLFNTDESLSTNIDDNNESFY